LSTPEVSQTSTTEGTSDKNPSLFSQYLDIKRKNQGVKKEMYPWAWGENTTQTKLLSVVDYQQGIFNLVVLESKVLKPLFPTDYKATQMRVKLGDIHPVDMIELHQQTSDMLYRGVLQSSTSERKMKNMVIKIVK
jgi:hypothetical protein